MRDRLGIRRDREGGATLVEFAIIAPLLFLLVFGIIEMSRAVFAYTTVWSAAREGARFATTTDDTGGTANYLDCTEIRDVARGLVFLSVIENRDIAIRYLDTTGTEVANCGIDNDDDDVCDVNCMAPPVFFDPDPSAVNPPNAVASGYGVEVTVTGQFNAVVPLLDRFLSGLNPTSRQTRTIFVQEEINAP